MLTVADHPLLARMRLGDTRRWSQSKLDFDSDVSAFEEVEVTLLPDSIGVRARTDLDMLSFYWDTDPSRIVDDAEHIHGFLDSLDGVEYDRESTNWQSFDIWVNVTPTTLETSLESIFDLLDLVDAHPAGAAFSELLEVRPGGQVIAFWDDLRAYLDARAGGGTADAGPPVTE